MADAAKGTLVAVGGGEDKREDMRVLRCALGHARGTPRGVSMAAREDQDASGRRVVIIPTASREPAGAAAPYRAAFQGLGAQSVDILDIRTPAEAALEEHVERVREADLVYMTGGDQMRLSTILRASPVLDAMRETLAAGGVVAGSSAGAAAMSGTMIAQGSPLLRKGNVQFAHGLALMRGAIVDTHFTERGRFGRLFEAVASHPGLLGLGIGEDTAVVVRGSTAEVVGTGSVVVVDGREIRYSDVHEVDHDHPVSIERIIVHTLTDGARFHLGEPRRALPRQPRATPSPKAPARA